MRKSSVYFSAPPQLSASAPLFDCSGEGTGLFTRLYVCIILLTQTLRLTLSTYKSMKMQHAQNFAIFTLNVHVIH